MSAAIRSRFRLFQADPQAPDLPLRGISTVSFGQSLREQDLEEAITATKKADLVIALGSTLSVYPAASLPLLAAQRGLPYVIINRRATEHDGHPSVSLRMESDVLDTFPPAVEQALKAC
ncbi:MAG: hypothetical protein ACREYE_04930 [Gammaproteobacteria bacterium]